MQPERRDTMNKIVNDKLYDTGNALYIGSYSCGGPSDIHWCRVSLYKTKTGEFFLYHESASTKQFQRDASMNAWCGTKSITPLSMAHAKHWAGSYLSVDEYVKAFGAIKE